MSTSSGTNTPPVRYMDTRLAYDAWSDIYDKDGNFLQALDTIEMKTLAPRMLGLINAEKPWRIVDLGCGTGRNTVALLDQPDIEITALDLSERMLQVAKKRLGEKSRKLLRQSEVHLEVFDMLSANEVPAMSRNADAIISTLVVEHVPLGVYFNTAVRMLKPGGLMLVTNMHSEMGNISQAGFIDPESGEKIRPTSYAHTVADLVAEAEKKGLEVIGQIDEKAVTAELAPQLGIRATKWIGVTVWFGGIFKKVG